VEFYLKSISFRWGWWVKNNYIKFNKINFMLKKIQPHNYRMAFIAFAVIQVKKKKNSGVVVGYKLHISKSKMQLP